MKISIVIVTYNRIPALCEPFGVDFPPDLEAV